jgi:hypothetical protein
MKFKNRWMDDGHWYSIYMRIYIRTYGEICTNYEVYGRESRDRNDNIRRRGLRFDTFLMTWQRGHEGRLVINDIHKPPSIVP